MPPPKADIIARLQRDILQLGGIKPPVQDIAFKNGLQFLRQHLPQGSLPLGAIHEFICDAPEDAAATGGFINGLLATCIPLQGPVVWISRRSAIFPPALKLFHIEPHNVVFIHPSNETEIMWVMEEALKCDSVSAVVAEMKDLNFTQSRRFQLAVEKTKTTGFIINQQTKALTNNACLSRWKITSLPSELPDGMPGVGHPRWQVALQKIRNGKPGQWSIEWVGGEFKQLLPAAITVSHSTLQQKTG